MKTQLEWFQELAHEAWRRGQACMAGGDAREARRWLDRAHRLAPEDAGVALSLATVLLGRGDCAAAAGLLEALTQRHEVREAWFSLAAARRGLGDSTGAAAALGTALARHVLPPVGQIARLADAIVAEAGLTGWCGLRRDGRLLVRRPGRARVRAVADGAALALESRVPASAARVEVSAGAPLVGSPILARHARRIEGVVATRDGGIEGWAWHPADPDTDPVLTVRPRDGGAGLTITARDMDTPGHGALGRPRRIWIAADRLGKLRGLLTVSGPGGEQLMGSPLDPGIEPMSAAAIALGRPEAATFISIPADIRGKPAAATPAPARAVAIVVPVYRGLETTLACLESVRATVPDGTRLIVVDDATPEPELARALGRLQREKRIVLLRPGGNRGFPASANAGLAAALRLRGRPDVVLLNSDTLVPPGWLEALRAAVHAAPDIGTATPLSNDATILSYPDLREPNPVPSGAEFAGIARLAAQANPRTSVEIPTAIGFCMYIRRECLAATGRFREDLFAQGYGEENDFCIRARHLGWRHVGVPGVFVAHLGGQSFGAARAHLIERNLGVLERLHPGYRRLIAAFQDADPLAEPRRRLDAARWRSGRSARGAVVMITHDSGGGVERALQTRCATLRERGLRPILLRPVPARDADPDAPAYRAGLCAVGDERGGFPNLRFAIPAELPALARLLRADRVEAVEVHHLLGHTHALLRLAGMLGVPVDQHVHDYAAICPRITFVGRDRRYCGEPDDIAVCEACVADLGSVIEEKIGVADLRARSAADLRAARRIIVPSADAASRLRRHFDGIEPRAESLEDDAATLPPPTPLRDGGPRRVCVIGGIGTEKGYDVLLACARDAAARALPLSFTVVGHTIDDARLQATGRAFVTGPYKEAEAIDVIRAQEPHLGWIPSVWPETWCFTLGHAWRAGLAVAAFDIGAPAERIRRTGRGWVLPLGLTPPAVNNALLALRGIAGDE